MYHKQVNRNTANNPVARAVAQRELASSVLTHKIRLYMAQRGEPCADYCLAIGTVMSVLAYAAELDPKVGGGEPAVRIIRGAISACVQMAELDSYDPTNTVAIERALDLAVELNRRLRPDLINRAWHALHAAGG